MADRAKSSKRARVQTAKLADEPAESAAKPPPARFLGRHCRFRQPVEPGETPQWTCATLVSYTGANKQTCELQLEQPEGGAVSGVIKVNLQSQPIHVLERVVFGPANGENTSESASTTKACAEELGPYIDNLEPMLIFTPLGPAELEAEDGRVLAHVLDSEGVFPPP